MERPPNLLPSALLRAGYGPVTVAPRGNPDAS
ncbi:MAG: hypothetical protein JWP20_406 [Roseomonas sp.]|nr:hypothetical protein [Roseomonas sp.]